MEMDILNIPVWLSCVTWGEIRHVSSFFQTDRPVFQNPALRHEVILLAIFLKGLRLDTFRPIPFTYILSTYHTIKKCPEDLNPAFDLKHPYRYSIYLEEQFPSTHAKVLLLKHCFPKAYNTENILRDWVKSIKPFDLNDSGRQCLAWRWFSIIHVSSNPTMLSLTYSSENIK